MPKLFSLGAILSVIGIAYVSHTIYTFYNIYFPGWCSSKNPLHCIAPRHICEKTDFIFQAWVSRSSFPPDKLGKPGYISVLHREAPCTSAWEENVAVDLGEVPKSSVGYYVHVLIVPKLKGQAIGISNLTMGSPNVVHQMAAATKLLEEERTAMNLIAASGDDPEKNVTKRIGQKVVHWHNKLRLSVMETPITFDRMSVPQEIYQFLKIQSESGGAMKYSPLLFIDNLSAKRNEFVPLRSQVVNMTLEYTPISVGKIRIIAMISGSLEQLKGFGLQESDLEDVVAIFTETNFYILAFTIMVTVLHLVFDFLAFKNDINFWRKRDTVVGLSGRTILWRAFSQIIVFLYLLDEKSSLLISIPAGIACFIEMWKVLKLWKFAGFERNGWRIRMKFNAISAAEQSSNDLDAGFVRKLSYLLLPLCAGGAVYSLYYVPHKSWYSWTVQSAVNGVYAFGFLFMIPQLYLNYKLKSVAHLPWKVFSYKALNTFIDDLFAFIVKMPLAHRLACFRDDIIFVFYLVQWYMYPVDKSRANEFGQSFEEENAASKLDQASGDAAAGKETKKTK